MKKITIIRITIVTILIAIIGILIFSSIQNKKEQKRQDELEAKREYIADQKKACLDIYEVEGKKWNNVNGWRYSETEDSCYVEYKETKPKTREECKEQYFDKDGKLDAMFFVEYLNCTSGVFEKSF